MHNMVLQKTARAVAILTGRSSFKKYYSDSAAALVAAELNVVDGRFAPLNKGPRITIRLLPARSASQQADAPVKIRT